MLRECIAVFLITTGLWLAGCSSNDEDQASNTDANIPGPDNGAMTGNAQIGSPATNSSNVTGREDALVRVVHASENAGLLVVVADNANSLPLIGGSADSNSGLRNTQPVVGPLALGSGSHSLQFISAGDFLAGRFDSPLIAIDSLQIGAGSSSTLVVRGDTLSPAPTPTPSLQLVTLVNDVEVADPGMGKIRVVHAAEGMTRLFGSLARNDFDLFLNVEGSTNGTPNVSRFSYATVATDYLEVPPGLYWLIATESGNSGNTRISALLEVTPGSVMTVVVRDLAGGEAGLDTDIVVIDDTATP